MNPKKLSNDALYEYIYQSGVDEQDIPTTGKDWRKKQVKLARTLTGKWRDVKGGSV